MLRGQIISEIKRLAGSRSGKPPGAQAFERETGIRESAWRGIYWARWSDALAEAGFGANTWNARTDDERLFNSLAEVIRHHGRLPTAAEYKLFRRGKHELPSANVIFGSKARKEDVLARLRDWTASKVECADIAALIPEIMSGGTPTTSKPRVGLVYLIKSGEFYKIGRSDEIERRIKEIRIALPEQATLVHAIRTDDPAGIEAYWHRRFANSRANGEWFKLTQSDVAAFRKRTFQ